MNLYAPIFNLDEFGPNHMLSALKAEGETIIYLPKGTFDFHVCFSKNEDFNAAAYEAGGRAYINLSIAMVMQLYHHILLLMGHEELLPQGGKEEPFEGTYRIEEFENPRICQYDSNYKQIAFYAGPENPKRAKIAELMTLFGMEFLIFHELGHHIGGHLRFLSETLGLQELYAQGNTFTIDSQTYQMLETDADALALTSLLESIRTKLNFYMEHFLGGAGELLPHCVMTALTTAFFLMEREGSAYDIHHAGYLPRDIRFQLVVNIFMDKLRDDYDMCKCSQTKEQLLKTFEICNRLLSELYTNQDPHKKIIFYASEDIRRYYQDKLLLLWPQIRQKLEPYAVIHLPE